MIICKMCSKFLNRKKQSRVNSLVKSTAPPNYAYLFYLQSTDVESGDCTRATVSERSALARLLSVVTPASMTRNL